VFTTRSMPRCDKQNKLGSEELVGELVTELQFSHCELLM
jgi:hypothetical protein